MTLPTATLHPLVIRGLTKRFRTGFWRNKTVDVLREISFTVESRSTFGFLGPNGAGKTTTIKTIVGLLRPSAGEVSLFGRSPYDAVARTRLGYLPENPSFPDHLTGREVLTFACRLLRVPGAEIRGRVDGALERVRIAHAAGLEVRKYSKGMVQRLGIAQAILHDPEFVVLDEPMSGLDPIGRREVKDLIRELGDAGRTVFFSTHIIADVEEVCRDVALVIGGNIVKAGKVSDLIGHEARETEVVASGALDPSLGGRRLEGSPLTVFTAKDEPAVRELIQRIWAARATVVSMTPRRYGLEEVFLQEVAKRPAAQRAME